MRSIYIEAQRAAIEHNPSHIEVELEVCRSEYENILLREYGIDDIISIVGARNLLERMDTDEITGYLNDIGVKTEWEE